MLGKFIQIMKEWKEREETDGKKHEFSFHYFVEHHGKSVCDRFFSLLSRVWKDLVKATTVILTPQTAMQELIKAFHQVVENKKIRFLVSLTLLFYPLPTFQYFCEVLFCVGLRKCLGFSTC